MLGGNCRHYQARCEKKPIQTSGNELLVIAVPVYMRQCAFMKDFPIIRDLS